jgi:hypothetical protein
LSVLWGRSQEHATLASTAIHADRRSLFGKWQYNNKLQWRAA